jgi:hypothetical protein
MIPSDAIYRVFPPSGTVDAAEGLAQINNNFWNGALNNAAFMLGILAIEEAYKVTEKCQSQRPSDNSLAQVREDIGDGAPVSDEEQPCQASIDNDNRSTASSLSKRTQAEDDAITVLLRLSLGFVIGGGVTAVASVPLMKWLPQTGMPGAGEGLAQIVTDVASQTLSLTTTVIGGGVPAEMAIQAISKWRDRNASQEDVAPEIVTVPDDLV